MDLSKHLDFFNPITSLKHPIHIIGCGAIGSTVAEMLTRMGVEQLYLYDFDTVSAHNIANQMFTHTDIGDSKLMALTTLLIRINPDIKYVLHEEGYTDQPLAGYVFLCIDDIDLRRKIVETNRYNPNIKAMFDFRMRLTDAQHYAANWTDPDSIKALLDTMQFSHDEAKKTTPVNACGTSLNIITTVRVIVAYGLSNFINFVKTKQLKKMILADSFSYIVNAF